MVGIIISQHSYLTIIYNTIIPADFIGSEYLQVQVDNGSRLVPRPRPQKDQVLIHIIIIMIIL
jgi:hypothetical protein